MIKIRISTKCIETWPYRHIVIMNDGKKKIRKDTDGKQIEKMLRKQQLDLPNGTHISNNMIV